MPTAWQTFPVEFRGGLITNVSPLQQGINAVGSARELRNFEPSIEGGYRRIQGYTKYNSTAVPSYGATKVQGGSQSGTTLNMASIFVTAAVGDKFTIAGDATEYTISNIAVGSSGYNDTNKTLTATITCLLYTSPSPRDGLLSRMPSSA